MPHPLPASIQEKDQEGLGVDLVVQWQKTNLRL